MLEYKIVGQDRAAEIAQLAVRLTHEIMEKTPVVDLISAEAEGFAGDQAGSSFQPIGLSAQVVANVSKRLGEVKHELIDTKKGKYELEKDKDKLEEAFRCPTEPPAGP